MRNRNKTDGLWNIPISIPVSHRATEIITSDRKKIELIQYLHYCCFSSTPSFTEGDRECKLHHMTRPQKSTMVKASASQHCNNPRTYVPGNKNLQSTKHVK